MADYQYHFYDLRSGAFIDSLPLEGVSFSAELRGVGTLSGSVPLWADGLTADRVLTCTIPYHNKVYVERDAALVWGGVVVPSRDYDGATGRLAINAEETIGAFSSRFLPNLTYTQVDQFDIARGLIATMQAAYGGDMGITFGGETSGVKRDRTYLAADRTVALEALTNLSEVINGFDYAVQVTWDDMLVPSEQLILGYPRLGRSGAATGLVLEFDRFSSATGNVSGYTWSDGPGLFTRSWATTETEEGIQLVASATNTTLLNQGYPLREQAESYDGITILATLQAHADALSAYAAGHRVTAQITVHAQPGMEVGDWQMGDDVLVRISDWRFPPDPQTGAPGFAGYLRIVGWEISPGPEGAETYVFTLADFLEAL